MRTFRRAFGLSLLAWIWFLPGCTTYKLGLPEAPPFRSIFVPAIVNKSFAPQMQTALSHSLRESFVSGGPIQLTGTREAADATLEITISKYNRQMATSNPQDTGQPASFYLTINAKGSLVNNHTGEFYFKDRNFNQKIQSFGGNKLVERERQNLLLLARNLSKEIHQEVTSAW